MAEQTIGKVAAVVGIGIETIRFYERQGLIEQPLRPIDGFRSYPEETLRRLHFIVRAKKIGFSLREIRELLGFYFGEQVSCEDVRHRAQRKINDLNERISALQKMTDALGLLVTECERGAETCPILANLAEEI